MRRGSLHELRIALASSEPALHLALIFVLKYPFIWQQSGFFQGHPASHDDLFLFVLVIGLILD